MITIGVNYGGPEQKGAGIYNLLNAAMNAIADERGPWVGGDDFSPGDPQPATGKYFNVGSAPAVNVIFYVPGSVLTYSDLRQIEPARFSRKQKLLLVAVPVPPEIVNSDKALDFVIDALHKANAIAAEVFAKKNVGTFDLQKADAIVEKAKAEIATGRYDKQVADAIAKASQHTQAALQAIAKAKEGGAESGK
jgi:acetylornithine deacetylase/succinyl-diaminopimelate desuccinylase-like protein